MLFENVKKSALIAGAFCVLYSPICVYSLPQHAQTKSGNVAISSDGEQMQIRASDGAVIDYGNFSIQSHEKVTFIQPHSKAVVVNRVGSESSSLIDGVIEGNGRVFLVNPNGVYFGKEARVDVGSLVVSTLDLEMSEKGSFRFSSRGNSQGEIVNRGSLFAKEGVILISPRITHEGSIHSPGGTVALLSSEIVDVRFSENDPISFFVPASVQHTLSSQEDPYSHILREVVNLEHIQEANQIIHRDGEILLGKATGTLAFSGQIDVSSEVGRGGSVTLLSEQIELSGAEISANGLEGGGKVLIGGEYKGQGDLPLASIVFMDHQASIRADAHERGDGGLVVLFSNDATVFNGTISVRGGEAHGNGGIVETSSLGQLGSRTGRIDAFAPKGRLGTWLLDPTNLEVDAGGGATYADVNCGSGTVGDFTVSSATLDAVVGNVCLEASNSIFVNEDINFITPLKSITFNRSVGVPPTTMNTVVNNSITTNGGSINFTGAGNTVIIGCSVTLDTTGGGTTPAGAPVLFDGTVDSCEKESLTINAGAGFVTFNQEIGGMKPLQDLSITAGETTFFGNVSVDGNEITLHTPVLIGTDITLFNYGIPGILFDGPVDSLGGTPFDLTVQSIHGGVTFNGNLGAIHPLGDLTVNSGGTTSFDGVSTVNTTGGVITFGGPVDIASSDLTLTTNTAPSGGANVYFLKELNSSTHQDLTVSAGSGSLLFQNAVGTLSALGKLELTANAGVSLAVDMVTLAPGTITSLNGNVILNSLYSSIGLPLAPFHVDVGGSLFVGAYPNVYLDATSTVAGSICPVKANPPCKIYLPFPTVVDLSITCPCTESPPPPPPPPPPAAPPRVPSAYLLAPGLTGHNCRQRPYILSCKWYFFEPRLNDDWFKEHHFVYSAYVPVPIELNYSQAIMYWTMSYSRLTLF